MNLSNRTVFITGGTGGIGLGLADAFCKAGSKVAVCGRDPKKLAAMEKKFPEIAVIPCDMGEARKREQLAKEALRRFPELDILVNNAGIQRYIDLKKGYKELKSGEDEIAVNFTALVELTALFLGPLMEKPSAIINISSALGFMPMANTPVYNATKAAVHTYTLALRQQLKGTSVKVIEIVPPMVDTDLNKEGRKRVPMRHRGISVADYIPTVIQGLQNDDEIIFHGDGNDILSSPRGETEGRLLNPSW